MNFQRKPRKILFVCTGNICRSPTAEGVLRDALVKAGKYGEFMLDSAGVDSWHVGQPPDERSQKTALAHGVDISDLRARNVKLSDFTTFDLILAMDQSHFTKLKDNAPVGTSAEIALYLPYSGHRDLEEVPDPYYGTQKDFQFVYTLCADATGRLMKKLF